MKTKKLKNFQQEIATLSVEELKKKRSMIIKKNDRLFYLAIFWPLITFFLCVASVLLLLSFGKGISFSGEQALACYIFGSLLFIIPIKIYIRKRNLVWEIDARLNQLGTNL
ncbi:MAG: hypothetical protein NT085_03665 [candidate division SR1 bacterium]|nr:hypothetical protein [candidate division SR1 bacterium]